MIKRGFHAFTFGTEIACAVLGYKLAMATFSVFIDKALKNEEENNDEKDNFNDIKLRSITKPNSSKS